MRTRALLLCLCLAFASGGAPLPQHAATPGPRLVLVLSIDQMRFDYLTRFRPLYTGGLKTLLDRGAVFSNAHYRHANSETGPGHAVITSGQSAWYTGIVANQWYDGFLKRLVNVVEDPTVVPLGGPGRGASPVHFLGFTIGDMLKKRDPAARAVGVSLKDRSAILMAGPRADGAYWYETQGGNFITSSYYTRSAPGWLAAWNAKRVVDGYAGKDWTRMLPPDVYEKHAGPDRMPGEFDGKDTVFPHAFRGQPPEFAFYDSFRRSPMADEVTLDVALQALQAHDLGTDDATDLLAIGFSATDVIGHAYGPNSQEILDQLLRLDQTLGRLFAALEARVGMSRILVALSADHGVMPLVERLQSQGVAAQRTTNDAFQKAVAASLEQRFPGRSGLVALQVGPDVWLDLDQIARQGLRRADVEAAVEAGLLATGVVSRVYTHARLQGEAPPDDPAFALMRASFFAPRSPHVTGMTKEFVYVGSYPGGTGHGGPYEDDLHVPVIFMGSAVAPGFYDKPAGPEDIAPTLGALLGLDYPVEDGARRLTEMFAKGAPSASGAPGSTR
jgi:predicted AlkP superfamily pyrophosphatase or phosphodiesterase